MCGSQQPGGGGAQLDQAEGKEQQGPWQQGPLVQGAALVPGPAEGLRVLISGSGPYVQGSGARTGWSHVPASHSKGPAACGTQPRVREAMGVV